MGMTNFCLSLEKRSSALTGELQEVHASVERIKREAEKLPELEDRIPEIERLIESARLLLQDANPGWQPEDTRALKLWNTTYRSHSVNADAEAWRFFATPAER
jgi:hypothetical protein